MCVFYIKVEKHDALCILPLNIVNEKIYIFLWFWLLMLGSLSTLVVVYRLGEPVVIVYRLGEETVVVYKAR